MAAMTEIGTASISNSGSGDMTAVLRQQETLRAVIESISSELELQPLLTRIVRHACDLIGADNGTIGLYDDECDLIRTVAVHDMPPAELGAEMPRGVGLAGQVLATGEAIILKRYGDTNTPTLLGLLENSVVGIPILWRGQLIGVFGIGAAPTRAADGSILSPARAFTEQDIETIVVFARHAAIAIENARLFASTRRALGETQLLYDTSARMSAAADVPGVIRAYLEQVAAGGRYACSIALYQWQDSTLPAAARNGQVWVRGMWSPQSGWNMDGTRHPYTYDRLMDPLLEKGETITISDVETDPRVSKALRDIQRQAKRPALVLIPLMARRKRFGLVVLSSARIQDWDSTEMHPYAVTASQLAAVIDSRLQQERLQEQERRFAVVEERQRLARDLHDSVTQLLFAITLVAQSLGGAFRRDVAEGARRVDRLLSLSRSATTEMRALLSELRPAPASELPETLRTLATDMTPIQGTPQISVIVNDYQTGCLSPGREQALRHIAREAVSNALRHAVGARRITITLDCNPHLATLTVHDDGSGFDASNLPIPSSPPSPQEAPREKSTGMGLNTMRERAQSLGGTCDIVSEVGVGTTVRVALPVREEVFHGE
jgi:signal transduction histidine kinase